MATDNKTLRGTAVQGLMQDVASTLAAQGLSRDSLQAIEQRLAALASSGQALFGEDEFPPCDSGVALYQLHSEPGDGLALYLNVLNPGKSSKPHDHTTWAAIAALQGEETNRVYRRTDDGSVPGKAALALDHEVVVQPGTSVSFMPDDIHSIHGLGNTTIRHLHLYGKPLDKLDGRLGFDLDEGTVVNYNTRYMTPAIVRA